MSDTPYQLSLFAERNRNQVYEVVIEAVEKAAVEKGITRKMIAEAVGRKAPQVSAWLSGPSNWTLDTVSHLLRSIGATMEYRVVFDEDQKRANYHFEAAPTKDVSRQVGARKSVEANPFEWIDGKRLKASQNEGILSSERRTLGVNVLEASQ